MNLHLEEAITEEPIMNFAIALKKLYDYLVNPESDLGTVTRERLLMRLESDVHYYIEGESEPTTMHILKEILDSREPRDTLIEYGFLDD